jgi:hypothetical protein
MGGGHVGSPERKGGGRGAREEGGMAGWGAHGKARPCC